MVLQIWIDISSKISGAGQAFGIASPCLVGVCEFADDVVIGDGARKGVVEGFDLAGGQHEIVPDRRVRVSVVLRREAVLRGEAVQIWHRAIADHLRVAVVFFDDQEDVN